MAVVTWKVVKIERSLKPEILTRVVNKENEKMQNYFFSNKSSEDNQIIHERSVIKWNKNTNTFRC